MITIYKSNSMKDCANYVLQQLSKVDQSNLSVMRTVIVPDRASWEAERLLLQSVGGSFNIQVKTFKRLANDILPKYEYLSKQAGIMALQAIIQDNKDKLVCYKKGVDTAGFVQNMYETISMMKYCKVSPSQLQNATLPRSVVGKAQDIAFLYQKYQEYTNDNFVDSADKLDLLCQSLPTTNLVTEGYFYLYDFDNFSGQELQLVEQLMLHSKGVTVACCVGNKQSDNYLYLNDIYNGVLSVCRKNGITPNVITGCSYNNGYCQQIGNNLFHYNQVTPINNDNFLQLYQGDTRNSEVYNLACQISDYVRGGGRYNDIYVVTSDIGKYTNSISTIFKQFDIPYFCDNQFSLVNHPYSRFVVDYLTVCKNNGKLDNVLNFVKNYLFCGVFDNENEQESDVYQFENYCLKYNVSYNYGNLALGCNDDTYAGAKRFAQKFDKLFKQLVAPNSSTVNGYTQFIRQLIQATNLDDKLVTLQNKQQSAGFTYQSNVTSQVKEKFDQVLLQAEKIIGNRHVGLDEFIKTLVAGLSACNVNVIPQTNDCVVFANMAKARKHDIKFLALLGANYGAMPIVKSDCKLLTDANLLDLCKAGVGVEPLVSTENKRERFSLFNLLLEPTDKLYVSYTTSDGVNTLVRSSFVDELCSMFAQDGQPLQVVCQRNDNLYTTTQAKSHLIAKKRQVLDNQFVNDDNLPQLQKLFGSQVQDYMYNKDDNTVTVDNGDKLYLKNSRTSVSQITDFFKCPYKFLLHYGLNLQERKVAEFKSNDLGTILHKVMELFVGYCFTKQDDGSYNLASMDEQITTDKAKEFFQQAIDAPEFVSTAKDPQMKTILSHLQQESIRMCNEVKKQFDQSCFVNIGTEVEFGGENSDVPAVVIPFSKGEFKLKGVVDRVDAWGNYFVIIDYKSGSKAATFGENNVYNGQKLQLLVYAKAIQDYYKLQPAGFYYFEMHDDFYDVTKGEKYVLNGRTLKKLDVAQELDTILKTKTKSERLKLNVTQKGEISGKGSALTAEQMQHQIDYAYALIQKAGDLMSQGYANVTPYKDACKYCDYKDICDFNDVCTCNERSVTGVTANKIDDIMSK